MQTIHPQGEEMKPKFKPEDQANEKWKNVQIAERLLNRYQKDLNASGVII